MTNETSSDNQTGPSFSITKLLHNGALLVLVVGGLAYVWLKPPTLNPLADPLAAQALALVQTHRAAGYPSILQAFNEHVRVKMKQGKGIKLGEWRVVKLEGDRYEVRINLREEGTNQWFEREYIWHVNLETKRVNAASLPADGLMPDGPEAVPPPRLPPRPPVPPT